MKSIAQALRAIKGYGWMKAPVKEIEDYIETGDAATLKKIDRTRGSGGYWGSTLAESLRPIEAWQEDDRRAVRALARAGYDDDVWQLLDRQIRQEKEGQDLHKIVAKELEAGGGDEMSVARDTMKWVHHLVNREKPNSAGRYLLSLTDAGLGFNAKAINKEGHYANDLGGFTRLMIAFAPERLPKIVNDLLVHETGKGNSRIDHGVHQLNLQVVAALLKGDKDKYGPVVAAAIPKVRDSWNTFHVAQSLFEAAPNTYAGLALTAARESLRGHPAENNHGPVADFMIQHFGREVLPDILTYFESKKDHALHWQQEILKSAAESRTTRGRRSEGFINHRLSNPHS